MILISKAGN